MGYKTGVKQQLLQKHTEAGKSVLISTKSVEKGISTSFKRQNRYTKINMLHLLWCDILALVQLHAPCITFDCDCAQESITLFPDMSRITIKIVT